MFPEIKSSVKSRESTRGIAPSLLPPKQSRLKADTINAIISSEKKVGLSITCRAFGSVTPTLSETLDDALCYETSPSHDESLHNTRPKSRGRTPNLGKSSHIENTRGLFKVRLSPIYSSSDLGYCQSCSNLSYEAKAESILPHKCDKLPIISTVVLHTLV